MADSHAFDGRCPTCAGPVLYAGTAARPQCISTASVATDAYVRAARAELDHRRRVEVALENEIARLTDALASLRALPDPDTGERALLEEIGRLAREYFAVEHDPDAREDAQRLLLTALRGIANGASSDVR